ncbi:MAG: MlaD family protein [Pseudomonadota bacterium]
MDDAQSQARVEAIPRVGVSWIWVVPLLVVSIASWTVYESYAERGVQIEIAFPKAKGIEAGKTEIRYKDVVIGTVESLKLSDDLSGVVATAVLNREIEPYLGASTDFWIVSAEISGTSFRGLNTLLSGSYIEMDWSGIDSEKKRSFEGRLNAPLTPPSADGRHYVLSSLSAESIRVGSPVVYRGIPVGRVEQRQLDEDYSSVEYRIFLESPYDTLVSRATRFYDVSGIDLALSSEGLAIDIASLQTLTSGGITFRNFGLDSQTAMPAGEKFLLYENRREAEESLFEDYDAPHYYFSVAFADGVEGLEPGAPVVWRGMRLGTVVDVQLELGASPDDAQQVVILDMQPTRIGLEAVDEVQAVAEIGAWVEEGLRAELQVANLLTGKKRLGLVEHPDAPPASLDLNSVPFPRIPSRISQINGVTDDVGEITAMLADLPLDKLVSSATRLMDDASLLVGSENMQAVPGAVLDTLGSMDTLAGSLDSAARQGEAALQGITPESAIYIELQRTIRELNSTARALRALTELLEKSPNALITGRR